MSYSKLFTSLGRVSSLAGRAPIRCLTNTYGGFRINGICAAPCTPLDGDSNIDLGPIPEYVDHFVAQGSKFAYVTGTTGEGNALTVKERQQVLEAWVQQSKGQISLIAHIGAGNLKDSQTLASHAADVGVDAIACVGPTYYKPENQESYVNYMAAVAKYAPQTPFMLYDIDFVTGITLNVNDFFHLAKDRIPTLQGVKHTSPSFSSMYSILHDHKGKFQVVLGGDDTYLQALAVGIDSTICNSYLGKVLNRLKESFHQGNFEQAKVEQERAHQVCALRKKYGFSIAGGSKAILRASTGLKLGDPRLPLAPIPDHVIKSLRQDLKNIGYFDWGV